MRKLLICLLVLSVFGGFSAPYADAWQVGKWVIANGKVQFEAINPWGDVVYYPGLCSTENTCDGFGQSEEETVNVGDVIIKNIRLESGGLLGNIVTVSEGGVLLEGEQYLDEVLVLNHEGSAWISAEDVYLGIQAANCQ